MFPLTFIEVGNTLSAHIMAAIDTASTSTIPSQADFTVKNAVDDNNNSTHSSSLAGVGGLDGVDSDPVYSYTPPLQRPETIFIAILFTLIFVVGVLGNGTLVIIFFRHRSMRNIPNTYILSLALADLLVIIVCVPLATLVYTTDSWTFGKSLCQITEFFKDVSIGVSVFTLTALSGERYCAIVNPLRKLQTKPLTVITATMIWLLSITFATPSLIMSDLQPILIDDKTNLTIIICSPFGKQSKIYSSYVVVIKALVYYLLPLFIIGVLYLMMAQRLHVSAREMPGETLSMQSRSQVRARRYVARMVVAFVVVFFICFFPYHLFELWFHLNPSAIDDFDDFWHIIRIIGFCTYFLNSCLNPVALYCVSGAFRAHFNQYLCCFCVKRQTRLRQHSTATGMMDTSIVNMSMRSTTNYNRASVHIHNAATCAGGAAGINNNNNTNGMGGGGGRLTTTGSGYRRQSTMQLHQHHQHQQHQHNGIGGIAGDNGRSKLSSSTSPSVVGIAQSGVILNDKR